MVIFQLGAPKRTYFVLISKNMFFVTLYFVYQCDCSAEKFPQGVITFLDPTLFEKYNYFIIEATVLPFLRLSTENENRKRYCHVNSLKDKAEMTFE